MSHFSQLDGATLLNPFTIHHKDKLKDGRPFMSTCVPQAVYLDLSDIRISHSAEWQENSKNPKDPNFKLRSAITARGAMRDGITVFRIDGEICTFLEVAEVMVKPLPKGHVPALAHQNTAVCSLFVHCRILQFHDPKES